MPTGYSHQNHLTSALSLTDPVVSPVTSDDSTTPHHRFEADASSSSMSYKVEELLALRDSVSESAVSIEKFADEDVIKGW